MKSTYERERDGSLSVTVNFTPSGSFLEQEEQIAEALKEAGRLATKLGLESFDTTGAPIVVSNEKHTSRGSEKKSTRRRTGKSS